MEHSWECKISSSDYEKYKAFFPDLNNKNGSFFRPWMDTLLTIDENPSESLKPVPSERSKERMEASIELDPTELEKGNSSDATVHRLETTSPQDTARKRRKPSRPHRSAKADDPTFRGVTVAVKTYLSRIHRSRHWQSQLLIKSYFKVKGFRLSRAWRNRNSCTYEDSSTDSDYVEGTFKNKVCTDPEEPSPKLKLPKRSFLAYQRPIHLVGYSGKQCASCSARRTPLWRDAEDGTPLCNACGIRYKKYRIRCSGCWLIPRKDGKSFTNCIRCGQEFRVTVFRRTSKH
ncbi:uncharacterized protein [Apostichopus japonicus]|uniref:uncharacterized protein n=1 Tax=Stichopus japonicus TaxID=307972 RepID=UPI003AB68B74